MDCKTSSNLIMAYVDQTITDDEWANLQKHLELCKECREEFDFFSQIEELIGELPMYEPSEAFEMKVMESIDHSLYQPTGKKGIGISALFMSIGIYITFLLGMEGMGKSLSGFGVNFSRMIQQLSLISDLSEKLFVKGFILLIVYPRKMIGGLYGFLAQTTLHTVLIYCAVLFTLMVLMKVIKNTLFRILIEKGGHQSE